MTEIVFLQLLYVPVCFHEGIFIITLQAYIDSHLIDSKKHTQVHANAQSLIKPDDMSDSLFTIMNNLYHFFRKIYAGILSFTFDGREITRCFIDTSDGLLPVPSELHVISHLTKVLPLYIAEIQKED